MPESRRNCGRREFDQILGEEGAVKEPCWFLIVGRCPIITNVVEMNREFGCIERTTIPEVFAWSNDLVPRFECHI